MEVDAIVENATVNEQNNPGDGDFPDEVLNSDEDDEDIFAPGKLERKCEKCAHLDGKIFTVDYTQSRAKRTIVAICQFCTEDKRIKGSITTSSNFLKHLKRKHQAKYEEFPVYKKAKKTETDQEEKGLRSACKFSQNTFNTNVVNYILHTMAPIRTVEQPSFRKIFYDFHITRNGQPLKHMSARTVARKMSVQFETDMGEIRNTLAEQNAEVCTTADVWSSKNRRCLGVTIHWIDPSNLVRKSAAIACRPFYGSHTHGRIASLLNEIHNSLNLDPDRLMATVTDNGSNFVKAFQVFGINIEDGFFYETIRRLEQEEEDTIAEMIVQDEVIFDEDTATLEPILEDEDNVVLPRHLRCASHTLNLLATTDASNAIKANPELSKVHNVAITRCTALWTLLRSPKKNELLKEILGVALLRPTAVRWNSLYHSLKQVVMLKDKILEANVSLDIRDPLQDPDYAYIDEYLQCMRPIAEAIDMLQGEKNCHYGYLLPTLVSTRRKLQISNTPTVLRQCSPLMKGLLNSIEKRFQNFFNVENEGKVAAVAAVTHPLFKGRWIGCLNSESQEKVRRAVMAAAETETDRNHVLTPTPPAADDGELDCVDFGEAVSAFSRIGGVSRRDDPEIEVLRYTKDSRTELTMLDTYPLVKRLFIRYNSPLPSSAPVERLFSYATMMNIAKYNRLNDRTFEERVLSAANAKR